MRARSVCPILVLVVAGCAAGCSFDSNFLRRMNERRQANLKAREALRQVREAERDARNAQIIAKRQEVIDQAKSQTTKELQTKLGLKLKQELVLGNLEVDVDELKERIALFEEGKEERLAQWRQDVRDWQARQVAYNREKRDSQRTWHQQKGKGERACGEKPPPEEHFEEMPPRPEQEFLAENIPLKIRVGLRAKVEQEALEEAEIVQKPKYKICQEGPEKHRHVWFWKWWHWGKGEKPDACAGQPNDRSALQQDAAFLREPSATVAEDDGTTLVPPRPLPDVSITDDDSASPASDQQTNGNSIVRAIKAFLPD